MKCIKRLYNHVYGLLAAAIIESEFADLVFSDSVAYKRFVLSNYA